MWRWAVAAVIAVSILLLVVSLIRHRRHRRRTLSELAAQRAECVPRHAVAIQSAADRVSLATEFARENIVRIDGFLSPDCLQSLRREAENSIDQMTPSFIPTHKKGRTLSYEKIHRHAPRCLGFYHSPQVREWVSNIVGMPVFPNRIGRQHSSFGESECQHPDSSVNPARSRSHRHRSPNHRRGKNPGFYESPTFF